MTFQVEVDLNWVSALHRLLLHGAGEHSLVIGNDEPYVGAAQFWAKTNLLQRDCTWFLWNEECCQAKSGKLRQQPGCCQASRRVVELVLLKYTRNPSYVVRAGLSSDVALN